MSKEGKSYTTETFSFWIYKSQVYGLYRKFMVLPVHFERKLTNKTDLVSKVFTQGAVCIRTLRFS